MADLQEGLNKDGNCVGCTYVDRGLLHSFGAEGGKSTDIYVCSHPLQKYRVLPQTLSIDQRTYKPLDTCPVL